MDLDCRVLLNPLPATQNNLLDNILLTGVGLHLLTQTIMGFCALSAESWAAYCETGKSVFHVLFAILMTYAVKVANENVSWTVSSESFITANKRVFLFVIIWDAMVDSLCNGICMSEARRKVGLLINASAKFTFAMTLFWLILSCAFRQKNLTQREKSELDFEFTALEIEAACVMMFFLVQLIHRARTVAQIFCDQPGQCF